MTVMIQGSTGLRLVPTFKIQYAMELVTESGVLSSDSDEDALLNGIAYK